MDVNVKLITEKGHIAQFADMIPEDIYQSLSDPSCFLLGALEEMHTAGAAVVQLHEDYGELLSIYVPEDKRHQGIGTGLLMQAVRLLRHLSTLGLYAVLLPEDEAVAGLLASFGMELEEEGDAWECSLGQLTGKLPPSQKPHTVPLSRVPVGGYNSFVQEELGTATGVMARKNFDLEISRVVGEKTRVTGLILVGRKDGELSVEWLQSDPREKYSALYLMQDAIAEAQKQLPPETLVRFLSGNESVKQLMEKLVGDTGKRWKEQRWSMTDSAFRLKGLDETLLTEEEEG